MIQCVIAIRLSSRRIETATLRKPRPLTSSCLSVFRSSCGGSLTVADLRLCGHSMFSRTETRRMKHDLRANSCRMWLKMIRISPVEHLEQVAASPENTKFFGMIAKFLKLFRHFSSNSVPSRYEKVLTQFPQRNGLNGVRLVGLPIDSAYHAGIRKTNPQRRFWRHAP